MIFISKYRNYKVVIKPRKKTYDSFGNERWTDEIVAQFVNNAYETDDPKIIEFLKNDTFYGIDFWIASGEEKSVPNKLGENALSQIEKSRDTFTCPVCGKTAKTLAGLKAHIRIKHPNYKGEVI